MGRRNHNPRVPTTHLRDHLRDLTRHGITVATISAVTGVAKTTIININTGRLTRVQAGTAHALQTATWAACHRAAPHHQSKQPATGTTRRLQALAYIGWNTWAIARETGIDNSTIYRHQHGWFPRITATHAKAITDFYDRAWGTPPPAPTHYHRGHITLARKQARDNGWVGPLAWDDDTIDNPHATPHTDAYAIDHRRAEGAAFIEDLEFLVNQQSWTRHGIAARVGRSWESIERTLFRHGRHDLVARIPSTETRRTAS